jgi:Protein of unknown function (DUF2889)
MGDHALRALGQIAACAIVREPVIVAGFAHTDLVGWCCDGFVCNYLGVNTSNDSPATATLQPRKLLHQRAYEIDSVMEDAEHFRLIGHMRDRDPHGLWSIQDTEPLTVHHMQVELLVRADTLTIVDVSVQMHVHPQVECPNILPEYQQIIGLSIVRGFTHKIREMFGGPKACTHIGAMLNAMAPVAIQSLWPFYRQGDGLQTSDGNPQDRAKPDPRHFERNRNSCHVWASEGPMFSLLESGGDVPIPLWAQERLAQRGVSVSIGKKE